MLTRLWHLVWPKHVMDLALLAIFAAVFFGSAAYPPDARLFPLIVSSLGFGLVLVMVVAEHVAPGGEGTHSDVDPVHPDEYPRLTLALLSSPVYCLLVWVTGFYVASLATLIVFPVLMGYRQLIVIVPVAVVLLACLWLIFSYAMDMELPLGLLGKWYVSTFVHDR
jgi:hypothetical protein